TAPQHDGKLVFGKVEGKSIVALQGRVHLYEGYTPQQVVMYLGLLKELGVKTIILTNAAGGINKNLKVGDFMMVTDHISSFVPSPLIGKNDENIGVRFPDMSKAYDKNIQKVFIKAAKTCGILLQSGVYVQLTGPQYETPAEIKMLSTLGADAVGMSTVIETTAAVHCGLKVGAISLITNYACGVYDKPLPPNHVAETAMAATNDFSILIKEIIKAL
ncbi:MAG: purine-nucleoside phosphorylase, partial [Ruminococcaceae bacterium]|nr:purine-nucleoside phosphorylase [Oscillospiraceae bacterium]